MTLKFAEIFDKIGFPAGVFNVVNGLGHNVGDYLSRHMDIDKVSRVATFRDVCFAKLMDPSTSNLVSDRFHWFDRHRKEDRQSRC